MRFRNTLIALGLLAIIGGYAFYSAYYTKPEEAKKLLAIKAEDISQIDLKYPDREIMIERPKGGEWRIVKPVGVDADQTAVNNLARAIADAQTTKTVDENPKDLAPFGLASPPTVVTVTTYKGQTLPGIEVGKTTPVGFSAYVKLTSQPAVMLTSSAFPSGMNKTLDQLRGRDLMNFKVDDVNRFTITRDSGQTIEIERDGDKWRITKPGNYLADPTQVRQLLSALVNAKVVDFVADTPASVSQYGLEKPHLLVTVYVGKAGASQSLLFGFKQTEEGKDGIYVRRGERTPVYTVHQWVLSSVDRSLFDLRNKTVFSFEPSQVEQADVSVGSEHFQLKRAGGAWNLVEGGKTSSADVPVVERFLDEIRDIKGVSIIADPAPSLAPFGLEPPAVSTTLVGKDGKAIGTIKLAKISIKPTQTPEPGRSSAPRNEYYATSSAGTAVYT